MNGYRVFLVFNLITVSICAADTFTNRQTGQSFNGYATQQTHGGKTLVRSENSSEPRWINLADYDVQWNFEGRKHVVMTMSIRDKIELESETTAFEKEIEQASNQGPLLIVIQIDTPGGRIDLMKRICAAIAKAKNCRTIAYICGGKYGGAYSAGAIISLACDRIYMAEQTAIGAATPIVQSAGGDVKDLKTTYGETVGEKYLSAFRAFAATTAEEKGRSGALAKAMVDKDITLVEVVDNDKHEFIEPKDKKPDQAVVRTWKEKGKLLTLTAAEAIDAKIADDSVNSMDELLNKLDAAGTRIVQKNEATKSRREYEKYKQDFDKLKIQIDRTLKEAERLSGNVDSLSSSNQAKQRQAQLRNLAKNISTLISQAKDAIELNKRCPDLHLDVEDTEKTINSLEAAYRQVQEQLKR